MKNYNSLSRLLLTGFLLLLISNCEIEEKEKEKVPVLTTTEVSDITQTSAISGGTVIPLGGLEITARGVCWGTSPNPSTLNNPFTSDGSGTGNFTSNLTELSSGTKYYVRAYATNNAGVGYGNELSFITLPEITTIGIDSITIRTARSGGIITNDGSATILARGVVWSTSDNPTLDTNEGITNDGIGTGLFVSYLAELSPTTTYYIRAYAINSGGVGYGNELIFKTYSGTLTDIENNVYYTTIIGSQEWMAENLAYLPSVSPSSSGSYTAPYYYVYGYEGTNVTEAKATSNYRAYGVLYNWPAALSACPAGWHLPTDSEWTELENYLIANGYNYDGTTTGNKIAKALATSSGWNSYTGAGTVGNTDYPAKRNVTGFSALPGGYLIDSFFLSAGYIGSWLSATEYISTYAWYRGLSCIYGDLHRSYYYKGNGFSVRCLRD